MTSSIDQFKQAIASAGLPPPDVIFDDGVIHRFSTNGKSNDDAGWYVLHTDGIPAGVFGCWRSGLHAPWCPKSDSAMTPAERDANQQRTKAMQAQRDADKAHGQQVAAKVADDLWKDAKACTEHAYLTLKGVQAHGVKVNASGDLVVPLRDAASTLHSLQTITPGGDKQFLSGGRVKGCYHSIGAELVDNTLIVCEGYATGASVHEATGYAVAVAFNAGNLEAVAMALRTDYPDQKIIIAADNDYLSDANPGLAKATAAAQAVGGYLAVPEFFGYERGDKDTDFNDLCKLAGDQGSAAVKACIERAVLIGIGASDSGAAGATVGANDVWPELQPLIEQIAPQEYPLDSLPAQIRGAVEEVCGFVKAPVALVAMSALASLSVASQAHVDVQRAEKLEGPTGLFQCCIADSGERKTSCDGYFTKALRDYEAREREKAKPLIAAHKTEMDAWTAQRGGIQEKIRAFAKDGKPALAQISQLHDLDRDKPTAPQVPRLLYSDATPEALASGLVFNWPSGGIFSSEAGVVLGGHAMSNDVAMRNMGRLNQMWDGKVAATDRVTTQSYGETAVRFTMSLQVQEPTLRAFFENTKGLARGTGFLARFLVAWPTSTMGTRMFAPPPHGWPALEAFNQRLTAILDRSAPVDTDGVLTPSMLTLAPDAKAAWVAFHDQIEAELACGGDLYDLRDVGSKAADNVVRLAALFHVFAGSIGPIDIECIESAAQIVVWHLTEAQRFLCEVALPDEVANPMRLEKWLLDYCKRNCTDKVPTRDVQRFGPNKLRVKKAIGEAVKELAELGRARLVTDDKKKFIQINPALLAMAP